MDALLVKNIVERAALIYPNREIAIRQADNSLFRYSYADFYSRIQKLANVLDRLDVKRGQAVGVFAWNTQQHLELDYATICKGSIYHPSNFRLELEAVVYKMNLVEDQVLFLEEEFIPLAEQAVAAGANTVKAFVIMNQSGELPDTSLAPLYSYEALMADASDQYSFPDDIDENDTVCVAVTGGTTGMPKGVPYSNRFLSLRALTRMSPQTMGPFYGEDVLLMAPPMFHAHGFNIPLDAFIAGAKLVVCGPHPDGHTFASLIDAEGITHFAANPIMGKMLMRALKEREYDISHLKTMMVGGDLTTRELADWFRERDVDVRCGGWGMTETLAENSFPFYQTMHGYSADDAYERMMSLNGGLPIVGLRMRVIRDDGSDVAADGLEQGEIIASGLHVISEYYRDPVNSKALFTADGWLRSGDIGVRHPDATVSFVSRSKDIIKSGGEWIPALTLENVLTSHPQVLEACVIGVPHEKFGERPLALIAKPPGSAGFPDSDQLRDHLLAEIPKWMVPDFVFIAEISKSTVGKMNKVKLRQEYRDFYQSAGGA